MAAGRARRWLWGNVPVPESHIGGLLVGAVLHFVRPLPVTDGGLLRWWLGGTLLLVGVGVVAWAVRAVGRQDVQTPSTLVTGGPYRYSRNPMYVGWTALYVGAALVVNSVWPLVLFPVVVLAVHRTVRREERALEQSFGEDYRAYRQDVRRY